LFNKEPTRKDSKKKEEKQAWIQGIARSLGIAAADARLAVMAENLTPQESGRSMGTSQQGSLFFCCASWKSCIANRESASVDARDFLRRLKRESHVEPFQVLMLL